MAEVETTNPEVRVTAQGRVGSYVTYGMKLFGEKQLDEITVRATGAALTSAVLVAETLKRRVKGLHQITTVGSVELESKKEGVTNSVSSLEIKLSTKQLDKSNVGYQEPVPEDQVLSEEQVAELKAKQASNKSGSKGGKGKGKKDSKSKGGKGGKGKGKGRGKGKGKKESGEKKEEK